MFEVVVEFAEFVAAFWLIETLFGAASLDVLGADGGVAAGLVDSTDRLRKPRKRGPAPLSCSIISCALGVTDWAAVERANKTPSAQAVHFKKCRFRVMVSGSVEALFNYVRDPSGQQLRTGDKGAI